MLCGHFLRGNENCVSGRGAMDEDVSIAPIAAGGE